VADSLSVTAITGKNDIIFFHVSSQWGKQDVFLYRFQYVSGTFKVVDYTTLYQAKFGEDRGLWEVLFIPYQME